ncbi:hypothetical protein JCM8547_003222 [Rhodosporidiobolus lusitaniae]
MLGLNHKYSLYVPPPPSILSVASLNRLVPLIPRRTFPNLDGVSGWNEVDGRPLEVYGVEQARQDDGICVDGVRAHGYVVENNSFCFHLTPFSPGRVQSFTSIRPFFFSQLQTTDDNDVCCDNEKVLRGLGTIAFKVWRVSNMRPVAHQFVSPVESKPIHEDSKKATLFHQAAFGAAVARPAETRVTYDMIDPLDSPFRRSSSATVAGIEGLIPRSPSPAPRFAPPPRARPAGLVFAPPSPPQAGPFNPRRSTSSTSSTSTSNTSSTSARRSLVATATAHMDDDELDAEIEALEVEEALEAAQKGEEAQERRGRRSWRSSWG